MCRELGVLHPDRLLEELTYEELVEWEAFDALEPVGRAEWRMENMLGLVSALIVNLFHSAFGKKGSAKPAAPKDFMPKWGVFDYELKATEVVKQTPEEMKRLLLGIAKVQNAKHKTKGGDGSVRKRS